MIVQLETVIAVTQRISEMRNDNPLQYSCLDNPMDRGAWWATVHRVTQSWARLKQLSMHAHLILQRIRDGLRNACITEGN